ncbi:MAG TPA: pyruvate kinase [Phycisphaeraceae bacterium]|nr:pyruvate kinase [Phycisphaeraceae bacterium]
MTTDGSAEHRPSLTKIIATIGPASDSLDMLVKLAREGVSLFRLNFSHGDLDGHAKNLKHIRKAEGIIGHPLGVIGDLSGPKIRVGKVVEGGIKVTTGQDVIFQREEVVAEDAPVPVFSSTYPHLIDDVDQGHRILINDGAVRMLVIGKEADRLICRVTVGGLITSGKGINLPNSDLSAPALTEKDWRCVDWALAHEVDYLALSFVRRADEVLKLKDHIIRNATCSVPGASAFSSDSDIPIIAKIERPEAIDNIDEIIDAADAIMVARGDLGVEMDLAEVPVIQKSIMMRCRNYGKPCIVATQMLQSMIDNPIPTRAEASDVANAIFDGADAVMLSGETAVGKYPDLAVSTMQRIALKTEEHRASVDSDDFRKEAEQATDDISTAIAAGARRIAHDIGADLIMCWSQLGGTARKLSQNDFHLPIIAFSNNISALRRMSLYRCVVPQQSAAAEMLMDAVKIMDNSVMRAGWAKPDDLAILVLGKPLGKPGCTNRVTVHRVGREL